MGQVYVDLGHVVEVVVAVADLTADEAGDSPLDDHTPTAPSGYDVNPLAQSDGDATQQPQGTNSLHAPYTEIQPEDLFHIVIGR